MLLPKPPPIEVIQMAPRLGAVLQAPGHSATPGWVLSVDPQQQVLLSPLVPTQLKEGEQVHLWTRDASDSKLRSLGLINPNQPVTLTKENLGTIQEGQLFEMTLESSQRADPNEPQGPILFMGRVVSLGDYEPKMQHLRKNKLFLLRCTRLTRPMIRCMPFDKILDFFFSKPSLATRINI